LWHLTVVVSSSKETALFFALFICRL
jgi:hypothetical protein